MTAYYNEYDAKAAAWLRELIKAGLIAPGEVDERSIIDVKADELRGFTQCHFFAGIGGWSYALRLAGWTDDRPVWTGSCPCQPFSTAGKGVGFADERHLWPHFHWLIAQCRPPVVFGEQVASKDGLAWIDLVQADLEGTGYAWAVDLCAADFGAPHIRQRLLFVAERLDNAASARHVGALEDAEGNSRHEARLRVSGKGRGPCGLADADRQRRAQHAQLRQDESGRNEGTHSEATWSGEAGRLAESDSAGREQGQRHNQAAGHGNTITPESCDDRPKSTDAPETFWSNPDWLYCRDGKWRPVESGTFPLANGVSGRVGLLRGYGNAIVPQVAAEVIRAYIGAAMIKNCTTCKHGRKSMTRSQWVCDRQSGYRLPALTGCKKWEAKK